MRITTRSAVIAAAALAATAVVAPLAMADRGHNERGHHTRIVLTEVGVEAHLIDNPAPTQFDGTNPAPNLAGDVVTFVSELHKQSATGMTAGGLDGSCTTVDAAGTTADCGVTVTLGKKSFRMTGPFDPATGGTLTIVGGTGSLTGAAGTDTIVNNPDGTATHTIDLVRS